VSLVEAARFDNRTEAELARLNLGAEGVEAVLFDAEMHSFGFGPMMPVRLMVLEEDLELARRLLADQP
jgi:Putative prokaryotic signal transducing protein